MDGTDHGLDKDIGYHKACLRQLVSIIELPMECFDII